MAPAPRIGHENLRRLRWQCRRGLLENDLVLTRFLDRHGAELEPGQLAPLRQLLEMNDNDLWDVISGRAEIADPRLAPLVSLLRAN